jgi:predicted ferric reductase
MQSLTPECLPRILSPKIRLIIGILLGIVLLLVIAGAASIPFYYESSTILYKFGLDRHLLRLGQVMGMVAGCVLLLQIILGARLKYLDRVFGLCNIFRFHRVAGLIMAGLIIIHPITVFIPENRIFIPLELRYWPEFVGLFLLMLIIFAVISSHWRAWLRFPFHRWWPIHRWAAVLIVAAFWVHVLSVSEAFGQKPLQMAVFLSMGIYGLLFFWVRTRSIRNRRRTFLVSAVEPAGENAVLMKIRSNTRHMPVYMPGQFIFLTFFSNHISKEEHPFSIASAPTRNACLEFVVRTTGDWTSKLNNLEPGDRVLVDGPFGMFSHLQVPGKREIIMIAGGIGVTPMLSMLRYMAEYNDQRKITLIWSNQTRKHIILPAEFQNLGAQLKGLRIVHVLTRDPEFSGEKKRLDRLRLKRLLSDCSRSAAVFICGPHRMMKEVYQSLLSLRFRRRFIFIERFSL